MKKVLTSGDIVVSRSFVPNGSGMVTIKDLQTNTYMTIYPEEASHLSNALKEILEFNPESELPKT